MNNPMDLFKYGQVHSFYDSELEFTAIIAIHSLNNNAAIGGCRCIEYHSYYDAFLDAVRLGAAMSAKSSIHKLMYGGAKSVIMYPKENANRQAIFNKFASYVNSLNGKYIAAVDSGTTQADMDIIAETSEFVLADKNLTSSIACDPAKYTAQGVFNAILGANAFIYGTENLVNKTFLIQGLGAVGLSLAKHLLELGANVIGNELNVQTARLASQTLGIELTDDITQACDYFVPCALGGVLTAEFCKTTQAKVIVGAANNQFDNPFEFQDILKTRNIKWVPDFLANGGGIIHVSYLYANLPHGLAIEKINAIKTKTYQILELESKSNKNLRQIIDEFAKSY